MAIHSKLISQAEARRLLDAREAVRAGSDEEAKMMTALWEKVAMKYIFIASAGKWTYRDKGTDKGLLADHAAQRSVDTEFRTPLPVISYGRSDGQVRIAYKTPQLGDVTNPWLEASFDKHCSLTARELTLAEMMIVDFWDTHPNKPRIVKLEDGSRVFNLWHEPSVRPCRDDKYEEPRWFLDVLDRFFGDHHAEREYFLDWCAHLVCRPEIKMPTSMLLISSLTGAGKGFIAESLKWMVGERNYKAVTSDALKGGFQSFIPGTSLVVVNELYEGGNYGFADKLKTLQSEDELFVNLKYGPQENVRNMAHFLAFSNNAMPINLEETDRRWFVFASPQREPMDADWWAERWQFLKQPKSRLPHLGALGSLKRWFAERMEDIEDTGRFKPFERPPATEHKLSIVEGSRSAFYTRVGEMLADGALEVDLSGRLRLSDIEDQIKAKDQSFRKPPSGQISADLEALGFQSQRTKTGRYWRVPEGYEQRPGMPI